MTQLADPAAPSPSWESVLAEVEEDVARSEALLRSVATPSGELRLGPLAPAELMLPAAAPVLPDPAVMPQVPAALLQRIGTLRDRIAEVSSELVSALEDVGAYLATPAVPDLGAITARPAPAPRFVDRAL